MIKRILDLSTGHIEETDNNLLKSENEFSVAECEYGYFFFVVDDIFYEKYSKSFKKVIALAKENDCSFICLDRDGDIINDTEKLNTNEW